MSIGERDIFIGTDSYGVDHYLVTSLAQSDRGMMPMAGGAGPACWAGPAGRLVWAMSSACVYYFILIDVIMIGGCHHEGG